jgi:cell fate regulator YaaT (PSP1 superfamily)
MCCLKYEQDAYEDLLRTTPKEESFVDTPEGRGTVVEINLLRQQVKVRMEDEPETVRVFSNGDIAILRNGKAKKNDPPIPADLAPISGGGKRVRREKKEENSGFLDPIKFRYREESVVEESAEPAAPPAEQGESRKNRRNRNNHNKPKAEQAVAEAPADVDAEPQQAAEEKADKPKNNHRRRYYHHRRKPKAGE